MAAGKIGKYERLDVLGSGTSGVVYLAWDTLLRRQVALKEIRADGAEMERLLEEARVLDRLQHPHIVQIHSVDVTPDGVVLLDMEWIKGRNLASVLKERAGKPLEPGEATRIILAVLDALAYAHERRIVHRDIKPANILIGDDGAIKLSDFGLAEALGTGSVAGGGGTYPYMAPEDFSEDAQSDRRSDLWAVGVLLYEMLTGRRPFTVMRLRDPFAWKRAVEQDNPPLPTDANPDLLPAWNDVCLRALARRKEERFASAQEFADAVCVAANQSANVPVPTAVPVVPVTPSGAFVFTSTGNIVYSLDEWLALAPRHWDESRRALADGRVEGFLRGVGETLIADVAAQMVARARRGESADKLLQEFLERSQGDETVAAPVRGAARFAAKERTPNEGGTVVAPARSVFARSVPRTEPAIPAATPIAAAEREPIPVAEQPSKPGVRWWYYPCLLLALAPPAVVAASAQEPSAHSLSDPVMLFLLAGEATGILSAILLILTVGTRMAWGARLWLLIPIGIGGLCMGGVVGKIAAINMGDDRWVSVLILCVAPLALLTIQATTARVLWRLWLAVFIALAAITCGVFAATAMQR